jgi:outer membrane protein OmpA-like peptidoglycan-associated protein/flagellar hook assembly protein FlgD
MEEGAETDDSSKEGDGTNIPSSLSWDGTGTNGFLAPEGSYTASLSVDYGLAYKPVQVTGKPFILDISPPSGTIVANPAKLTPDGKGGVVPVVFNIVANSDTAPLDSWALEVKTTEGRSVLSANGTFPQASPNWDGTFPSGTSADFNAKYSLEAKVVDRFGNAGRLSGTLGVTAIPVVVSAVSILPQSQGFSPNGDGAMDRMTFSLTYGQPQAVLKWTVRVLKDGVAVRTFSGDGANLPSSVSWGGKRTDESPAPEGAYSAELSIDYGTTFKPVVASSQLFVLDVTPPHGAIRLSQTLYSPIDSNPDLTINLDAESEISRIGNWSLRIYDPAGNLFRSFEGKWPDAKVAWNGRSADGQLVESAETYPVEATVRDEFGNAANLKSAIPVDILVEKTALGYRILSSRVFFKPFTADYVDVSANLASQNAARLDQLALRLSKYPGYRIKIYGHAVMINWNNPAKGKAEQEEVLLPLSQARADAVKEALVALGLDPAMIVTQGLGASQQLVPDSDLLNRWRNRRVALYLERE